MKPKRVDLSVILGECSGLVLPREELLSEDVLFLRDNQEIDSFLDKYMSTLKYMKLYLGLAC